MAIKTIRVSWPAWELLNMWAEKEGVSIAQVVDKLLEPRPTESAGASPQAQTSRNEEFEEAMKFIESTVNKAMDADRKGRETLQLMHERERQRQHREDSEVAKMLLDVVRRNTSVLAENSIVAFQIILSRLERS